jgi:hypothetical protein
MATPWSDVANSPAYKGLSPEDQKAARDQYFHDVLAPQIPEESQWAAFRQFRKDTDPQVAAPKGKPGVLSTLARETALGIGPAAAGRMAQGVSGDVGEFLGTAIGGRFGAPELGGKVGHVAGSFVGSLAAAAAAAKGEQKILDALPETSKTLGLDPASIGQAREAHPGVAKIGEIGGSILGGGFRPTLSNMTLKGALQGAGFGVAGDVAQQMFSDQPFDYKSLAESALLGGALQQNTRYGQGIENLGRRLVGGKPVPYVEHAPPIAGIEGAMRESVEPNLAEPNVPPPPEPDQNRQQQQAEDLFRNTVLEALKASPTIKQFREVTGLSHEAAKSEMDRLVNEGYLTYNDKSGRYSLVPENAQYAFVNEGERPRAALNPTPSEQVEPTTEEFRNKRQMGLFDTPAGGKPLYVDSEGRASTDIDAQRRGVPSDENEFFRQHALKKQQAEQARDEQNKQQVIDALQGNPSIKTVQDVLGLPYNEARKYMKSLEAQGVVVYEAGRWKLAPDFVKPVEATTEVTPATIEPPKVEEPETVAPAEITAPPVEGKVFDEDTYGKALDAIKEQGKATTAIIQKASNVGYKDAVAFMKELRNRGITDSKNRVIGAKSAEVAKPAEPVKPTEAVKDEIPPPTEAEATEEPLDKLPLTTEQRMGILADLFKTSPKAIANRAAYVQSKAPVPERPVEDLRSKFRAEASDAYENDKIDDATYEKITDELKKPTPNFARVERLVTGESKQRATTAVERFEISKRTAKAEKQNIDAETDKWLAENDVDLKFEPDEEVGDLRFQRTPKWYYSRLERVANALPEKAFASPEAVLNKIKSTEGIKKDELEAVGFEPFLDALKGQKMSPAELKKQVQDFLSTGGFQLNETLHETGLITPEYEQAKTDFENKKIAWEKALAKSRDADHVVTASLMNSLLKLDGLSPSDVNFYTNVIKNGYGVAKNLDVINAKNIPQPVNDSRTMEVKFPVGSLIRAFGQAGRVVGLGFKRGNETYYPVKFVGEGLYGNTITNENVSHWDLDPIRDVHDITDYIYSVVFPFGELSRNKELLPLVENFYKNFDSTEIEKLAHANTVARGKYNDAYAKLDALAPQDAPYAGQVQDGSHSKYRLFLLQNPNSKFEGTHFDEQGVIAHIRTTDRVGKDGKRVLFVEEIQSDLQQRLRDKETIKKFKDLKKTDPELYKQIKALSPGEKSRLEEGYMNKVHPEVAQQRQRLGQRVIQLDDAELPLAKVLHKVSMAERMLFVSRHVKPGPFVNDDHGVTRLALKRILSHAAEHGYDRVEFVRGEESQAVVGGEIAGQRYYYDTQVPSNLRKLVNAEKIPVTVEPPTKPEYDLISLKAQADAGNTVTDPRLDNNDTNLRTEDGYRLGVNLTPEARQHILQNQFSLFNRSPGVKGAIAHEDAVAAAKEATKGWKNAPNINVVRDRNELPFHLQNVPDDTRGFYDPATKTVHVISENAPSVAGIKATVFHEALGHYGLGDKFRGDLDGVLRKMYDNPNMRKAADEWLKNNSDTYDHLNDDLRKARAVEEVLAERSEGGRVVPEGGLRGIYNRVIAWVRDWMRRMGMNIKYSDNDIAQILRQAHENVVGSSMSVAQAVFDPVLRSTLSPNAQREADLKFMRSYTSVQNNKPSPTKELMERGREFLSEVTPAVRRGIFSAMSVNQIANEYERMVPSLRTRHDVLNKKGAALRESFDYIGKDVIHANKVFDQYSYAERQKMYDIMNRTTRDQIEVLDDAKRDWHADKTNPLYREFMALPKDVQDVYRKMRETFYNQSQVTLGFMHSIMSPSQYQRLTEQWRLKRLKVYMPLFRTGDHWVAYTDKNGEFVKRSFETIREREMAIAEAQQDGAKDIERYNNLQQLIRGAPPTGFFSDVVTALRKAKVDDSVIESVVDSYLNLLPAKSTLQMTRKRQGTAGYEQDVLKSFANVATRQAQHINNMRYNHELDGVMKNIRKEVLNATTLHEANPNDPKGLQVDVAGDLLDNVEKSHQAVLNPTSNKYLNGVQYFNYLNYLAGNVSTAFVAMSHLPTVVYPVLSGIKGFDAAAKAMFNASKYSVNYHFHGGSKLSPEIADIIKRGHDDGVLGERRAEDISEFKTYGKDRYLGIKARADAVFNKVLGAADKTNRDTTLLAAYELHRDALAKEGKLTGNALRDEAYKRAKQNVYDTLGSAFVPAQANIMRQPLAKLFLTFKSFALNRDYVLFKALKDGLKGESPEVRKAALMQTIGFFAMGALMGGVQGMPLVGWAELLAKLMNDVTGGDENYDPEEMVKQSVGVLAYKGPLNYALNLNIADRVGWDNMFWRDDEKRRNDVGFASFAAEKLMGPSYTYVTQNLPNFWRHMNEGHMERATEDLLPKFASNAMRGVRYGLEGATNKDGVPIKQDVSAYNAFMQVLGFAPADVAEIQKENSNRIGMEKKINNARQTLLTRAAMAQMNGDEDGFEETLAHIEDFNERNPGVAITSDTLMNTIMRHHMKLAQSVNGISLNPKLRAEIEAAYPEE